MKTAPFLQLFILTLLLTGCASNPPQDSAAHSKKQVLQKLQEIQGTNADSQQPPAPQKPLGKKSIVPDISEAGQRGEMARKMLAKSTAQFLEADVNRDYQISAEEARQYMPFVSREFSRYDKNNDQSISWQEMLGHDKWPQPEHGK